MRWAQPARGDGELRPVLPTRADLVFALVQNLADLCAEAEGRDPLPVPRLENELALVDQVRVMVLDLVIAPAPDEVLHRAIAATNTTRASL